MFKNISFDFNDAILIDPGYRNDWVFTAYEQSPMVYRVDFNEKSDIDETGSVEIGTGVDWYNWCNNQENKVPPHERAGAYLLFLDSLIQRAKHSRQIV